MTPDLSHRLGDALGGRSVGVKERHRISSAAAAADAWADLPADVQALVEDIESRPGWLDTEPGNKTALTAAAGYLAAGDGFAAGPGGDLTGLNVWHLPGKHDQSTHGGGGAAAMHDEATIRDTFSFRDEKTGMSAEVTGIRSSGPQFSTYVDIAIKDRDGKVVGNATRTIRPADQKTVQADGIALRPGMQGQGFATRYNAKTEAAYREHGIERVTTFANIDVGGYSNARAGYNFQDQTARMDVALRASRAADKYDFAVQTRIGELARSSDSTPIQFAMVGHTPGATMWPGKEIMLGSSWAGVKIL